MPDKIKLSPAQRRGLEAVRDGRVRRVYTAIENHFQTPAGVGAAVMWRLLLLRLIKDGPDSPIVSVELTDSGRRWLWENP